MPQEISISYQAVKSKVYRLIDPMVEGSKTESEVRESMRRWWMLIHPADRPVAEKYLAMVLSRSTRSREVSRDGAVPLQRNLGCNRRRSLCRKRLQTSACPRLGEGLQDHRQPHPIQPSFLTAFAYSSLFAASSFKPGPDRAFFPVRTRGESPECHSIQFWF